MKILYIADGRSPISLNWMRYFTTTQHQVHLVSSYFCQPELNLDSLHIVPLAFSQSTGGSEAGPSPRSRFINAIPVSLRTSIRQKLVPLTLKNSAQKLSRIVDEIQPDLVHAMRIPYEGMLACLVEYPGRLLVSVWGNDFTLHAPATRAMRQYTRSTLARVNALHTDCHRDLRLAADWGFDPSKPSIVLPGAGGVQMDLFYPPESGKNPPSSARSRTVINPRGLRAYVRNDAFFRAIPLVMAQFPGTRFICPAMAGEKQAQRWIDELGIGSNVDLLPHQSRQQMGDLFRSAAIAVSPSEHDGTPNTLLEAMACGCYPIAGDIESLREWITPGLNGSLVDPADPAQIAAAIIQGLQQEQLRARAASHNLQLIAERAEYNRVMQQVDDFYQFLVD